MMYISSSRTLAIFIILIFYGLFLDIEAPSTAKSSAEVELYIR